MCHLDLQLYWTCLIPFKFSNFIKMLYPLIFNFSLWIKVKFEKRIWMGISMENVILILNLNKQAKKVIFSRKIKKSFQSQICFNNECIWRNLYGWEIEYLIWIKILSQCKEQMWIGHYKHGASSTFYQYNVNHLQGLILSIWWCSLCKNMTKAYNKRIL